MASPLLAIYLNDHLAGAAAGLELFRRASGAHRGTPLGAELDRLTAEVQADRDALLGIMRTLEVPVRQYKVLGGWAMEKAGRLKLNGHLLTRSPLSTLVELEGMRLGVEGKAAGWRALRAVAARHPGLDAGQLDRLGDRAQRQIEVLERLRLAAAGDVLT